MVVFASTAWANANIQEMGSVLIFPKVFGNDERDTLIEITNTGNSMAHAKCFYVNAARTGQWSVMDFEIWLTKQQPTQWLASRGRAVNIFDEFGSPGAGFDPGRVPPVPRDFEGELKCVQVDQSGAPLRANKLIGKATLIRRSDADASTYNALALKGNPDAGVGNNDRVLELNNTPANQGEYDGCPVIQTVSVFSESFDDPIIDDLSTCAADCLSTTITFVPCDQNLELARPSQVNLLIFTYDEFETEFSTSITVDCWFNERLDSDVFAGVFDRQTLGVYARFIPVDDEGRVVGIAEELRQEDSGASAWAAFNLHAEGTRVCSDRTPNQRAGLACSVDADCPGGFCIDGGNDQIEIPLFD
jgi:hypothetical protein